MPTFSELEKNHIRERLIEVGREHFSARGLKKTSLEDLTRPAGIAKSSFYAFFESKEALYLELIMIERRRIAEELSAASPVAGDAREEIRRLLRAIIGKIEEGALTRRVITHPEEWRRVLRRVSAERAGENLAESTLVTLSFLGEAQESGEIIDASPEVIAGVFRAVVTLTTHKDDIGRDVYPEVLEMVIDFVAAGLAGGGGWTPVAR